MRQIPESLDAAVVAAIDARLDAVEADEGVRLRWAIESGSRAWGFPSPDSDYDCRFFYVRSESDYLSLWRRRDVIETPLDEVFDVNGWDLAKAIRLLAGGNATVGEWVSSPIVYRGDEEFRDRFAEMVALAFRPDRLRRHHLHLARRQIALFEGEEVRLKRIFYALRPAYAMHWLRLHDSPPPMALAALRAGVPREPALDEAVDALLERKAVTRELGTGPVPAPIDAYLRRELTLAAEHPVEPSPLPPGVYAELDAFFRWAIRG